MSVINQVLNDIEQRKKLESAPGVDSYSALEVNEPRSYLLVTVLGLILLCAIGALGYFWLSKQPVIEQPIVKAQLPDFLPIEQVIRQELPVPLPIAQPGVIPSPVVKARRKKPANKKIVEFVQPVILEPSPVEKPAAREVEQVIIVKKLSIKAPVNAKLQIKSVTLSNDQLAKLKFNQGLELMEQGLIVEAQKVWQQGLALQPANHEARERLALSYFELDLIKPAFEILQQGITRDKSAHRLSLLKAKIHLQLHQDQLALAALNKPYRFTNTSDEMIELAGAIAQQLQVWPQAQLNYAALVKRQPDNQKWLMGLAISLDGQGKSALAILRYSQIVALPGISQLLSNYAHQRIAFLTPSLAAPQSRDNNG